MPLVDISNQRLIAVHCNLFDPQNHWSAAVEVEVGAAGE